MNAELTVLIIESRPQDVRLVEAIAFSHYRRRVQIEGSATLEDALLRLSQKTFDIILLSQYFSDTAETQFAVRMLSTATSTPVIPLSTALKEDQGNPQSLIRAIAVDNPSSTLKEDAFQRLKSSEERYALAIEGSQDGIWDWDLIGDRIYYSDYWKAILGLENTALSDSVSEWFDRVHSDDIAALRRSLDEHLSGRSEYFRCEYRIRHTSGHYLWVLSRGAALWDDNKRAYRIAGSQTDIDDHKQLAWQATHDALTNLTNRQQFIQSLGKISQAQPPAAHILCYLDLDHFKVVNDTCGHAAGDELLRQVSALLSSNIRRSDLLARLGGDEFGLLIYDCHFDQALGLAHHLCSLIQKFRFLWQGKVFSIGVSIGLVPIPTERVLSADELLDLADTACYTAKNKGRNQVQVYSECDASTLPAAVDFRWSNRITQAIDQNLFCLHYQVIKPVDSRKQVIWEILLRLPAEGTNGEQRLMPPMAFIPPAERYDLMINLDRWTIRRCFQQIQQFSNPEIMYSLNLSGHTLNDDGFIPFLEAALAEFRINPHQVCFEINETTVIANLTQVAATIDRFKALGCCFALDNFGSGVSSLVYLQQLPVDYLKIDGSLISAITHDKVTLATVQSIISIGHVMGVQTIAEHVSNSDLSKMAQSLQIDYVQGFEIARPRLFSAAQVQVRSPAFAA
ncbi:MAG: EAL domain-containing protein [Phormidesmis sp.]